jgi:hypothetical protein
VLAGPPRLIGFLALLGTLVLTAWSTGGNDAFQRTLSDGILRLRLPGGWYGSVGPGTQSSRRVAWVLAGNFRFASDYAATHEGAPQVPRDRLLITIGDFVPAGASLRWPRARSLHLPTRRLTHRAISWHVRFSGRALSLAVTFGSKPDARAVRLANEVLASVRPV